MTMRRIDWLAYGALVLASVAYVLLTVLRPIRPSANTFHLSLTALRALELSIILPLIAVWFIALYGSLKFKSYSRGIADSPDGKALNTASTGLLVLVSSLVLTTIIQTIGTWMPSATRSGWTILSNYVGVIGPLVAFGFMYQGSKSLAHMVNFKDVSKQRWIVLAGLVPLSMLYVWVVLHNPYRSHSPQPDQVASYYLPDGLIILTLIVPYIVTWYIGMVAAIQLKAYHAHAKGIIYRGALAALANGVVAVIASSLFLQMVTAMGPTFRHWGLNSVLILVYIIIVVYALGHVWILAGARRLARIEEAV